MSEWTWTIGQVVAAFGRVGELKVRLETDFPDRYKRLAEVALRPPSGEPTVLKVQQTRPHKGQVLLKLEGIDSIDEAERWRGAWVQIPRAAAVPLPQGSYYVGDLVGFDVATADGRPLGKLDAVLAYPAQDLLQVGGILIPMVKEFVAEVDVPGRRIVVTPPAGLLPDEEPGNAG